MIIDGYILTKIALVGWDVIKYVAIVQHIVFAIHLKFCWVEVDTLRDI